LEQISQFGLLEWIYGLVDLNVVNAPAE